MDNPRVVLRDAGLTGPARWLAFGDPTTIISASRVEDAIPALAEVAQATTDGWAAAGFVTYEAAPACDPTLTVHAPGSLPLLWFGLYRDVTTLPATHLPDTAPYAVSPWRPTISKEAYWEAIARIKAYIASGDTYQVNFTQRLHANFTGDPWSFFLALDRAQRGEYSAYFDLGAHVICSASPELFFTRQGSTLTSRPMKGTVARGLTTAEDAAHAAWLQSSEKTGRRT